ncbi:hypothetical protein TrispH2_002871 [Trichoplax sp. H2]|nr:hypothetical protein TrispH2_002871 [Trichoplax sp. H2]|eukprot:RDD44794.1 hypothetical protein TrispH2_002871 [Trichoplax sp. H2]
MTVAKFQVSKAIHKALSPSHFLLTIIVLTNYMVQYAIEINLIVNQQGRRHIEPIANYYLSNSSCIYFNSSQTYRLATISMTRPSIVSISTINLVTCISTAISSILLASWSDRYGKRSIYALISIFGLLCQAIMAFLTVYGRYNPNLLIYGSLVLGLTGGLPTFIFSLFAIVGEGCPQKYQGLQWATLTVCMYIGYAISLQMIFRGLSHYNLIVILIICISIYIISLIFAFIFIHLKYNCSRNDHNVVKKNLLLDILISFGVTCFTLVRKRKHKLRFRLLLVALVFTVFSYAILTDLVNTYLVLYPYCWTSANAYIFESIRLLGIAAGGILGWLFLRKYLRDSILANIGLTCVIAPLGMIALGTPQLWLLFGSIVGGALGGIAVPCMLNMISKTIKRNEYGMVFCWIAILYIFGKVISEYMAQRFMILHANTRSAMIAFAAANLILLPPKVFLIFLTCCDKRKEKRQKKEMETFSVVKDTLSPIDDGILSNDHNSVVSETTV